MGYSMRKNKTYHRKKTVLLWVLCMGMMVGLAGRLVYLCVFRSVYYSEKADDLHERERGIKAARGRILDANGEVLAANRTVCTISVIHSQIEEPEAVIAMLVKELGISEETARKRVEKRSSIERVKTNVDKDVENQANSVLAQEIVKEIYTELLPYLNVFPDDTDGVTGEGSETGTDDPNVAAPVQEDDTENSAENSNIENGGLTNAELDLINEE